MKKLLSIFLVFSLLFALAACGEEATTPTEAAKPVIIAKADPAPHDITEEAARACLVLSNEAWWCTGDFTEHGSQVSAYISADYYISEVIDSPYDVKSVTVRSIKLGDNEYIPVQTGSPEQAERMLRDFGYGEVADLNYTENPQVVFHFEGETEGVYDAENMILDVPLVISCSVVFQNDVEVIVEYADTYICTVSGGYIELSEGSFDGYQ